MNKRFEILAILIFVKIIGIAVHAKAGNYLPGYTCDESVIYRTNFPEIRKDYDKYSYVFSKSTYRCGNTKGFIDV
tara:strand:- start:299 stop:523 length:225 start_codon:yes stop_codon:yes gene_type:complete